MSQDEATIELTETLLAELSGITDETLRAQFLEQNQLYSPVVIKRLNDAARTKLRVDPRQSIALADAAVAIAESLRSEELLGPSLRAKANALYVLGDNQSSLQCHDLGPGHLSPASKPGRRSTHPQRFHTALHSSRPL